MNNIKKNNPGIFLIHVLSAITRNVYSYFFFILFTASAGCSPSKQIARQASALLMNDSAIISGHTGISIYEPATGKFWYNHNATKYFTPASNTKLFTLYAGMKYLGDSLLSATIEEDKGTMNIFPNGDPAFLNPEFIYQPLLSLLKQTNKKIIITDTAWKENALGRGWAWDDYNDDHMTERSPMPVFGNIVTVRGTPLKNNIQPPFFTSRFTWDSSRNRNEHISSVTRERSENLFHGLNHSNIEVLVTIPFITNDGSTGYGILEDVLGKKIEQSRMYRPSEKGSYHRSIFSIPKDELFRIMMHRSDNFFAEQTLLMVSNERLGFMKDEAIIDTLLGSDLKTVPQKPKWVDGSGLSRYNLFTPQSFIYILKRMHDEFGFDRLKYILPTGGQGTLRSYYNISTVLSFLPKREHSVIIAP